MERKIAVGSIVAAAGGLVAFLASFLTFWSFTGATGKVSQNAWEEGFMPVVTMPAILGLVIAVLLGIRMLAPGMPERVAGFAWSQITVVFGFAAVLNGLSYLIVEKFGASLGAGFWLMFLGSIAVLTGGALETAGVGGTVTLGGAAKPAAFPQPQYPQQYPQPQYPQPSAPAPQPQYPPAPAPPATPPAPPPQAPPPGTGG